MSQGIRLVRRIAGTMLVIGMVGWFGTFLIGVWLTRYVPSGVQLPLSELEGTALDHAGNIYCMSDAYSRLQVYDPHGRFLRGWFVGIVGHGGSVRLDDGDRVHIFAYMDRMHFVFDARGRLLKQEKLSQDDKRYDDPSGPSTRFGYEYVVRHPTIWPQVVKVGAHGQESVVVRPNLLLWIFAGPLPAWLFLAFAIVVLNLTQRYVRKDSPRDDSIARPGDRDL